MKTHPNTLHVITIALLLLASAKPCFSFVAVVAPNNLATAEGNTSGSFPFDGYTGSMRYQQVFNASQFSAISGGGGYISVIGFRADGLCQQQPVQDNPLIQINLSTTSKGADSLSPVFSENVGLDDHVVRGPSDLYLSGACAPAGTPKFFSVYFALDSPFYYNPNAGNLLLDIRNLSGPVIDGNLLHLDSEATSGDSISSILAFNANAQTADQLDSSGFITEFTIQPVPEPSTWTLVGLGLSGLAFSTHRKSKRRRDAAG